jgi:hypothetical protein
MITAHLKLRQDQVHDLLWVINRGRNSIARDENISDATRERMNALYNNFMKQFESQPGVCKTDPGKEDE